MGSPGRVSGAPVGTGSGGCVCRISWWEENVMWGAGGVSGPWEGA